MTKYNNMFHVGDQAWRDREPPKQRREWLWQGVVVIVEIAVLALFAYNVTTNLEARNIRSGFAFLGDRSSFEIGEALIDVSSNDGFGWMFLAGMLNTIRVAIVSILTATL